MYLSNKIKEKIEWEVKNRIQNYFNSKIPISNIELNEKYYTFLNANKFSELVYEPNEEEKQILDLSNNFRHKSLTKYKEKYKNLDFKIGIHIPPFSIAAQSLFGSWIEGLNYMGVKAFNLGWSKEEIKNSIKTNNPNIIISSHHDSYLSNFDWNFIDNYKKRNRCKIFLIVFDPHLYNRKTRTEKFKESKKIGVDTYICFWLEGAKNFFKEYYEEGFNILSIPFSANPLKHYYIPMKKEIDYVFLGTGKGQLDKTFRYMKYFLKVFSDKKYKGIINGPGWYNYDKEFVLQSQFHKYVYALSKIGLNLHISDSMKYYSEVNERTYILGACGIFQLVDKPKALNYLFPKDSIVSAENPKDYYEKFLYYLHNQKARTKYILDGISNVYLKDTIFQRMEKLIKNLLKTLEA